MKNESNIHSVFIAIVLLISSSLQIIFEITKTQNDASLHFLFCFVCFCLLLCRGNKKIPDVSIFSKFPSNSFYNNYIFCCFFVVIKKYQKEEIEGKKLLFVVFFL